MMLPRMYFVDQKGEELPSKDGKQHIRQYAGYWRVRVDGVWEGKVAIEGAPLIFLDQVNAGEWELGGNKERLKGSVGTLCVRLINSSGRVVGGGQFLQIEPANASWDELQIMLEDIGVLSILSTSCTEIEVSTPVQEDTGAAGVGVALNKGYGAIQTASSLIELYEVLKNSWSRLQQHPIKSVSTRVGAVNLSTAKLSAKLLLKRKMEPYRTTGFGLTIKEDIGCAENEFLVYIIEHYLIALAKGIRAALQFTSEQITKSQVERDRLDNTVPRNSSIKLRKFGDRIKINVAKLRQVDTKYREDIEKKIVQLNTVIDWACNARNSVFLQPITTPRQLPAASLRLIHSPTYGPIYAKFVACQAVRTPGFEQVLYLLECIQNCRVRPAWEVYELWCVVKLYTTFVVDFKMKPPENEQSLFQQIKVVGQEIQLPKNKPFRLIGKLGNHNVDITLWYEKDYFGNQFGNPLVARPDIVVGIRAKGVFKEFCFDAKYRDYSSLGDSQLVEDVYQRAYQKYQRSLGFETGFILHTDPSVDYWGEVKIKQFLRERFQLQTFPTDDYASHTYGAIFLKPGRNVERQFKKLRQLLFQYHGLFRNTCLDCGYRLKDNDMQHDWNVEVRIGDTNLVNSVLEGRNDRLKGTGVYCACPKCGNFWVIHRCKGANHLLIKTNIDVCLHRHSNHSEHAGKWMYICPACGSDPSSADFKYHYNEVVTSDFWSSP